MHTCLEEGQLGGQVAGMHGTALPSGATRSCLCDTKRKKEKRSVKGIFRFI
jgi:hypothetical protein